MFHPTDGGSKDGGGLHHSGATHHGSAGGVSHNAFYVHGGMLGGGRDTVVIDAAIFMFALDALVGGEHPGFTFSFGGMSGPVTGYHNPEWAGGPGGGINARPGFEEPALVMSEKELTGPGNALLFYVHASGIGIVALEDFLEILRLRLGLDDITYRTSKWEPDCILPWNEFEDPTDDTMPPGWLEGLFGKTTKLSRRYQNASRIGPNVSAWRYAQLRFWLWIRDHRAAWNNGLFEALSPRAGELLGDSQLHLSKDKHPQKVTIGLDGLAWKYYDDPAMDPAKNFVDGEVKLILKIDAELFFTEILERWNRNPMAFQKNQRLAFDFAKCAFKELKEVPVPFSERRQALLAKNRALPYYKGRWTAVQGAEDGYRAGTLTELSELERQQMLRERRADRLAVTEWGPTFTPTPSPGEPDNDPTGDNAFIAPLVPITGPSPNQTLPTPPLPAELSGSGVDLERAVGTPKIGKDRKGSGVVEVKVHIPTKDLGE